MREECLEFGESPTWDNLRRETIIHEEPTSFVPQLLLLFELICDSWKYSVLDLLVRMDDSESAKEEKRKSLLNERVKHMFDDFYIIRPGLENTSIWAEGAWAKDQ
jgi:hypothetical protein